MASPELDEAIGEPPGFVAVARFEDPAEAAIAAGALEAQGFAVLNPGNHLAAFNFLLRRATGGAVVYVLKEEAEAAKVILREANPVNPEAVAWRKHPQVWSGVPLAAVSLIDPLTGYAIADARKSRSTGRKLLGYGLALMVIGGFFLIFVMAMTRQP